MTLWTPAYLAITAKLWLKADDLGLSNGASVTAWTDSSGSGANATVPGWAGAPTYATAQLNSLGVVRFLAASLQAMDSTPTTSVPYTAIGLAHVTSTGANAGRIFSNRNGANAWLMGWWSNTQDAFHASGWINGPTGLPAATTSWFCYAGWTDGVASTLYRDGTLVVSNASGVGGPGNQIGLMGSDSLGSTDMSDAEVAEFVLFNYVLSTGDRQLVEGYLAWKWGRQASLPGGHPYASAAPTVAGDVPARDTHTAIPFTRGAGGGGKI